MKDRRLRQDLASVNLSSAVGEPFTDEEGSLDSGGSNADSDNFEAYFATLLHNPYAKTGRGTSRGESTMHRGVTLAEEEPLQQRSRQLGQLSRCQNRPKSVMRALRNEEKMMKYVEEGARV